MVNINNGLINISKELTIFPGFSFEQFKHTRFYNNQDGVKIIYLNEQQYIDGRRYIVSLFFRESKIYMVSLICCDKHFSEHDEEKRKEFHDEILIDLGLNPHTNYDWGKISSDYDAISNLSSINIIYFKNDFTLGLKKS